MTPGPFLPDWNFQVLKELFLRFPHGGTRDTMAQFFTSNALAGTWIYAAVSIYTGGSKMIARSGAALACLRFSLLFVWQSWQRSCCGCGSGGLPRRLCHASSNSIRKAFGTVEIRTVFRAIPR